MKLCGASKSNDQLDVSLRCTSRFLDIRFHFAMWCLMIGLAVLYQCDAEWRGLGVAFPPTAECPNNKGFLKVS